MSPFARALQAADALPPEDVSLFVGTLVERVPIRECPSLFTGRTEEEIRLLVLWLLFGFEPADQVELLGSLVEKVVDRAEPASLAGLVRLGQWIDACLGSAPR